VTDVDAMREAGAEAARLGAHATDGLRDAVRSYGGAPRHDSRGRRFDLALSDLVVARQTAFQAHTEPSDIPVVNDFMAGWEAARWYLEARGYSSDDTVREFLNLHDLNEVGEYEDGDE
jgi:hypothetical protein